MSMTTNEEPEAEVVSTDNLVIRIVYNRYRLTGSAKGSCSGTGAGGCRSFQLCSPGMAGHVVSWRHMPITGMVTPNRFFLEWRVVT